VQNVVKDAVEKLERWKSKKSGKVLNTKWRFRILDGEKPACTLLIPPLPPFFMH
jgi:hypothetical protein